LKREIAADIFGTITLKIKRKNSCVAERQQLYGSVGDSQQETYIYGTEISNVEKLKVFGNFILC
jgi:hypothetical protein